MRTDRTNDKERFATMIKGWVDQFAHSLANSDTKNYIEQLVIEPFLRFILERSFPYMIIVICIFCGILIFVVLTFILLLMNVNKMNRCPFCENNGR
jgi:phosphotransferase system  glucose/maltose/N-acetylglucosamine-specific IIC component